MLERRTATRPVDPDRCPYCAGSTLRPYLRTESAVLFRCLGCTELVCVFKPLASLLAPTAQAPELTHVS